jgi:hypothetical protein
MTLSHVILSVEKLIYTYEKTVLISNTAEGVLGAPKSPWTIPWNCWCTVRVGNPRISLFSVLLFQASHLSQRYLVFSIPETSWGSTARIHVTKLPLPKVCSSSFSGQLHQLHSSLFSNFNILITVFLFCLGVCMCVFSIVLPGFFLYSLTLWASAILFIFWFYNSFCEARGESFSKCLHLLYHL